MNCELEDKIFDVNPSGFDALALEVFRFQYRHNPVYQTFCKALGRDLFGVTECQSIPFLPISFFKSQRIATGSFSEEVIFESSGTTNTGNSCHFVRDVSLYRRSFTDAFRIFYGDPQDWCIAGLLPAYLERQQSSLVMMADELIRLSDDPDSAFYLYNYDQLAQLIRKKEAAGKKTLIIGVTFALLDFAGQFQYPLHHTVMMETGGMKGRRKEITRQEVHALLREAWRLPAIHSEYGMTELLSQAYSSGEGIFACAPWMKIMIRADDDPLSLHIPGEAPAEGLINVIDLANLYSCSFIATDDLGRLNPNGTFEVSGRMDSSDVRGCSQLYL